MMPMGRITKSTKVWDAEKLLTVPALVVHENEALEELAEKAAESPACKTLAVVDGSGKLVGVLPVSLLIDGIFLGVMPEEFLVDIVGFDSAVNFARKAVVREAKDLMQTPVSVKMDDTVKVAFEHMHKNRLSGLPIVDDENRVIGYLDMLELLMVWIKIKGE